jgi:hypothetical protein
MAIRRGHRHRGEQACTDDRESDDIAPTGARDEEHAEGRRREHYRSAEVRLHQEQAKEYPDHEQRLDEPHQRTTQLRLATDGVAGDEDQHHHARSFRGLEVESGEADPATATINRVPDAGDEHRNQQDPGEREQQQCRFFQPLGSYREGERRGDGAGHDEHELPLEIEEGIAGLLARDRHRGRGDDDEAEQHDRRDDQQRHEIEVDGRGASAAASRQGKRTHEGNLPTAAANRSPRSA